MPVILDIPASWEEVRKLPVSAELLDYARRGFIRAEVEQPFGPVLAFVMTAPACGLENLDDDEILEFLRQASKFGKELQGLGQKVRY